MSGKGGDLADQFTFCSLLAVVADERRMGIIIIIYNIHTTPAISHFAPRVQHSRNANKPKDLTC